MPNSFKRRAAIFCCLLLLTAITVLLFFGLERSRADIASTEKTAEDDPVPKPSGKLILDSVTGLPAVTPLTVSFVRSPDKAGPGGKGRYVGYRSESNA
jgi:hypothetical protein